MTESDNFLSRWSRRKQEATTRASLPAKPDDASAPRELAGATPQAPATPAPDARPSEPAFDLCKLPSLDSIGPATDVSVFMQPGVPASLSHAALRRAWSADPAIRDFVGLAENAWDFTAPESIPGFGPLLPVDNVKRMVAQMFNEQTADLLDPAADSSPSPDTTTRPQEVSSAQVQQSDQDVQRIGTDENPSSSGDGERMDETNLLQRVTNNIAPQHSSPIEEPATIPNRRRHGGALPT